MLNWFYNWLDPKILRIEAWVNRKVTEQDKIDIDLDKITPGEVRDNPMFRQPPDSGEYGPFLANLQGGEIIEFLAGPGELEAFALLKLDDELWWRHRDSGTTEDFRHPAFDSMQDFFNYAIPEKEKFWSCQLRTKALQADAG